MTEILQSGGGWWGVNSFDNDHVHDLLASYNFIKFKDDERIFETKKTNINIGLTKLFDNLEKNLKKQDKITKNIFYSKYNFNTSELGVVLILLLKNIVIPKKYLTICLIQAYKNYIKTYNTQNASGWINKGKEKCAFKQRLSALSTEIKIINYAINYGKSFDIPEKHKSREYSSMGYVLKTYKKYQMDDLFLKYTKVKSKYSFLKYEVLPMLNANILDEGTVMEGYNGKNIQNIMLLN